MSTYLFVYTDVLYIYIYNPGTWLALRLWLPMTFATLARPPKQSILPFSDETSSPLAKNWLNSQLVFFGLLLGWLVGRSVGWLVLSGSVGAWGSRFLDSFPRGCEGFALGGLPAARERLLALCLVLEPLRARVWVLLWTSGFQSPPKSLVFLRFPRAKDGAKKRDTSHPLSAWTFCRPVQTKTLVGELVLRCFDRPIAVASLSGLPFATTVQGVTKAHFPNS